MSDPIEHREGLENEPHLSGRPIVPDESNALEEEPVRASEVEPEPVEMSASDEPALEWAGIDRGVVPGFAEHYAQRTTQTSLALKVLVVTLAAASAGPFAVLGALMKSLSFFEYGAGYMAIIVFGPVIEEMMKVAAILWVVERKPWLVPFPGAILLVGMMGGLGFAAIENLMYLHVYIAEPTLELVRWRWTVCVMMHAGCSIIAAIGVRRMLLHTIRTGRPAPVSLAFGWLVTAMLIHGAYNALAIFLSIFGIGP